MDSLCPFGRLSPGNFKKLTIPPHHYGAHEKGAKGKRCRALLSNANDYLSNKIYPESMVPLLQTDMDIPCVLVWGHSLFLITTKRKETVDIVPTIYTDLKLTSHIPLSLFLLIVPTVYPYRKTDPQLEVPLTDDAISQITQYYDTLGDMSHLLWELFSGEVLLVQMELVSLCSKFVQEITKTRKTVSFDDLLKFTSATTPILKSNIKAAVRALIDSMHSHMMLWKDTLTEYEWDHMRVVVAGSPMARDMEMHMQYFAKLLGTNMESDRIMYAEKANTMDDLVELLGIHTTDFSIGEAFFGNADFMHHDIQASDCTEYLQEIFPEKQL